MKLKILALLLVASVTFAAPDLTWNWDPPTQYTNGNSIPGSDVLTYTLHCNNTPGEQGTPYEVQIALDDPGAPPSVEDMAPVHGGQVGEYWCASTARSTAFASESGFSNEANFTVTAVQLGFVPNPPTNLTIQ